MELKYNNKEIFIPSDLAIKKKALNDFDHHINIRYQQYQRKLLMDYMNKKSGQNEVSPNKLDHNNLPNVKKNGPVNYPKEPKQKELTILNFNDKKMPISNPSSTRKTKKLIFNPLVDNNKKQNELVLPRIYRGENSHKKPNNERLYHSIDSACEVINNYKAIAPKDMNENHEKAYDSFTTVTSINSRPAIDDILLEKNNSRAPMSDSTIENAVQYHLKQASKNIRKIKNNFMFQKGKKYLFQMD